MGTRTYIYEPSTASALGYSARVIAPPSCENTSNFCLRIPRHKPTQLFDSNAFAPRQWLAGRYQTQARSMYLAAAITRGMSAKENYTPYRWRWRWRWRESNEKYAARHFFSHPNRRIGKALVRTTSYTAATLRDAT